MAIKQSIDYQSNFFYWIVNNSKKLNLHILYTKGISKYIPGIINVAVYHRSKKLRPGQGLGWGYSKYESLIKGTAEVFEREFMHYHDFDNSNGCAVHVNLEEAKIRAVCELIERDAFFCHYLTETPFDKLKGINHLKVFNIPIANLKRRLREQKLVLDIYQMKSELNYNAIFVSILDSRIKKGNRFQFGTACSESLEKAIEQALIEAIRSVDYFDKNYKGPRLNLDQFNSKKFKKIPLNIKHSLLRLDATYTEDFRKKFLTKKRKTMETSNLGKIKKSDIKIKTYSSKTKYLNDIPLYFVKAESKKLQGLYFGETKAENINLKRLRDFKQDSFFSEINLTIHPFS